jgi:hypothetical protein
MSTPVITPPVEEKPFDQAAFIKARNEGKPVDTKAVEEAPVVKKPAAAEETQPVKVPRHIRRENNRLREEAAELRGRLAAYEALGVKPNGEPPKTKGETDPEPQQAQFATEAEYNRALGKWEARQEAAKIIGKRDEQSKEERETAELQAHVKEMDAKFQADVKLIPDWEEVRKANLEDEDAPKYDTVKDALLIGLLAHSDVRAYMLHHFAKVPTDFQKMIDFRGDDNGLIAAFKRLEGKVETVYSSKPEAAQASDKSKGESKERTGPENTEQARAPKAAPRPSTEVAARGGTAPPEEPLPGTKAWMEKRNAQTGGR